VYYIYFKFHLNSKITLQLKKKPCYYLSLYATTEGLQNARRINELIEKSVWNSTSGRNLYK